MALRRVSAAGGGRPGGRATLATRNRGEAPTRWVQKLKGKEVLEVVGEGEE